MRNEEQGQTIDVNMQNDKAKYLHYTAKRENGTPSENPA
jgi:hypothetical protein